ncbi:MAG TPA: alpha/beta fold hydrolase [Thermoanaerobaculia bacterium]|nr:alpha/beta fold hydrolase [Thermoanaerobaculia bacterium]
MTPGIDGSDAPPGRLGREGPIRLALGLGCVLLAGCSMMRTRSEVERTRELGLVAGRVESPEGTSGVRVVLAGRTPKGVRLAGVAELGELDDRFGFVAEAGPEYFVGAFLDRNGNEHYDAGEPVGFANEGRPFRVSSGGRISDLAIRLSADGTFPEGVPRAIDDPTAPRYGAIRFAVGEVVTLDDPRFAPEVASDAMWRPLAAVTTTGAGIYFLRDYDPGKTPVLFVHGIGGSPRDLRALIESLDRDRFQPWLLHYPSGFRLDTIATAVGRRLGDLHGRLGFERLVVVAHSMGGLVSRSVIQRLQQDPATRDLVALLVTLASPLGGHDAAEWGLRFAPEPVPSWIDMAPGSEFLEKIAEPLDPPVPWYLFFGFRRERSAFMPMSSDSVVAVESELPWWAQQQARKTFGFDDDHMEILEDPTVVATLQEILAEAAAAE